MITLAAIALSAALLPRQATARQVHWLDDIPAEVGLLGCVQQGSQTAWVCTGHRPSPDMVAAAAASGTTSMGGGGHRHGRRHSPPH
jgi:hypothetical protein